MSVTYMYQLLYIRFNAILCHLLTLEAPNKACYEEEGRRSLCWITQQFTVAVQHMCTDDSNTYGVHVCVFYRYLILPFVLCTRYLITSSSGLVW